MTSAYAGQKQASHSQRHQIRDVTPSGKYLRQISGLLLAIKSCLAPHKGRMLWCDLIFILCKPGCSENRGLYLKINVIPKQFIFFFFVNIIELMLKVLNSMIIWFKIHCSGAKLCKNYESSFNNCGLNCLAIRFSVQKKLLLGTVCLHKTSGYQAMMLHTAPGSTLFFLVPDISAGNICDLWVTLQIKVWFTLRQPESLLYLLQNILHKSFNGIYKCGSINWTTVCLRLWKSIVQLKWFQL